jgi:hypothetical protein
VPQSLIRCEGVDGSKLDYAPGSTVHLSNHGVGGEVGYTWALLSMPVGSAAVLSSTNTATTTFVADREGSYLVRLVVTDSGGVAYTNQAVAGVPYVKSRLRNPAPGETTEASASRGWSAPNATDAWIGAITKLISDGNTIVAADTSGGLAPNCCVFFGPGGVLSTGDTIPGVFLCPATSVPAILLFGGIVEGSMDSASTSPYAAGTLLKIRRIGILRVMTTGPFPTVGDDVYVSDAGVVALTPGTFPKVIGKCVETDSAAYYDVFVIPGPTPNLSVANALELYGDLSLDSVNVQTIGKKHATFRIGTEDANDVHFRGNGTDRWCMYASGEIAALDGADHKITGVDTPTAANGAVNKGYADTKFGGAVLLFGNTTMPNTTGNSFLDAGNCDRVAQPTQVSDCLAPFAGKLSVMMIRASTGPAGDTETYGVTVNGVSTALIAALPIAGTEVYDLTHSVTVAAKDHIGIVCGSGASISSGSKDVVVTVLYTRG